MTSKDLYELLGIPRDADAVSIKSAYRKKAIKYHPDKNKGNKEAEEKFKEVTFAYEVLSDTSKRQQYDRFGIEGVNQSAGYQSTSGGFGDIFSDIFEDFFGGQTRSGGASRAQRGADLGMQVEIDFIQAVKGCTESVKVKRHEQCRVCSGEGAEPGSKKSTCPTCHGAGEVTTSTGFFSMRQACGRCRGDGQVIERLCSTCHGSGREATQRSISIKIPAGVDNGTRIRVTGEGEGGIKGGPRGDLFVEIFVAPHEMFKRNGLDLICEVPISFTQAALGGEIEIPTLDGSDKLEVQEGTQTGRMFKIKGKGVPSIRGDRKGDLLIRVVVETPTDLNAKQKNLLKQFAEAGGEKVHPISKTFMKKMKDFLKV